MLLVNSSNNPNTYSSGTMILYSDNNQQEQKLVYQMKEIKGL